MGSYVKAADTAEFQDGSKKKVSVQGHEIMLAMVGGKYYAIDARCPHIGGDLTAGTLEGLIVTCPRHGSQFDISDGHNVRWMKGSGLMSKAFNAVSSAKPVKSYNIQIEGSGIMVEI